MQPGAGGSPDALPRCLCQLLSFQSAFPHRWPSSSPLCNPANTGWVYWVEEYRPQRLAALSFLNVSRVSDSRRDSEVGHVAGGQTQLYTNQDARLGNGPSLHNTYTGEIFPAGRLADEPRPTKRRQPGIHEGRHGSAIQLLSALTKDTRPEPRSNLAFRTGKRDQQTHGPQALRGPHTMGPRRVWLVQAVQSGGAPDSPAVIGHRIVEHRAIVNSEKSVLHVAHGRAAENKKKGRHSVKESWPLTLPTWLISRQLINA